MPGESTEVYRQAERLGGLLAEAGWAVCNGGYGGLMEASARGAQEARGHTVGITCTLWPGPAKRWIAEEIRTTSFMERLTTLVERGDAYIVLPGGTGTLAELALAWEMMNKSALSKSMGGPKPLLVMAPYWQPVIGCLEQERELATGAARPRAPALGLVTLIETVDEAMSHLGGILRNL